MNSQNLGPAVYDRDREMDDRHRALQQREEMARRDQERERERDRDRDRESNERYQSTPHHSSAGSIPIHQPVASRISGAIHSPGGLLANHGSSAPSIPLGAPSGPVASFGGPLHEQTTRPAQQSGPNAPNPQHQLFAPQPRASGAPSGSLGASSGGPAAFSGPLQ